MCVNPEGIEVYQKLNNMAFEEVTFERACKPKLAADEIRLTYKDKKKHSICFNQTLTEELRKEGFCYCTLEWDRDTDELRIKFRKFEDKNAVKLCIRNKEKNLMIQHWGFVLFIKDKLKIEDKTVILHIGEDRSNSPAVQTRYITK